MLGRLCMYGAQGGCVSSIGCVCMVDRVCMWGKEVCMYAL